MAVVHFPQDADLAKNQSDYMKIMADQLREGKPLPITVVGGEANFGKVVSMRHADKEGDGKTGS